MKIIINIDENMPETEITISCNQLTDEIENIMATLRIMNQQMLVYKDEENHLLDVSCISYIEALERKTFVYTENDVFESKLRLYEIEEKLCRLGFAFMLIMFIGHTISMLSGAAIGVFSKNQMMATSLTVPIMMIFSFLPMLSMFNDSIKKIAKFFYSEQLYLLINDLNAIEIKAETIVILGINVCLILSCFIIAYQKVFIKHY